MKAKVRVTVEVIVAAVLTYFICRYFHWNLFDSTAGIHGGAAGLVFMGLMAIPEGIVLWMDGDLKKKPKSDDDVPNLRM